MVSRNVMQRVLSPVAACAARCGRMLGALGRLGKRRMRALKAAPGVAAAASSFVRMARALRLIALLELRVRTLLARGPAAALPAALPSASETAASEGGRLSDAEAEDQDRDPVERPERLKDYERPDRERFPTFDLDKLVFEDARPLTEIVAAICRDLGLSREATRRAQAPFAELEALMAGQPPQPQASPSPPPRPRGADTHVLRLSKRARRRLRGRPP